MREIILDTETTGLRTADGHRVIEVGAVEMINRRFTKNNLHHYLNPDREIDAGAQAVHGITNEFLRDKPRFEDIVEEFLAFIRGATLIIHNAPFDLEFLNYELARCNRMEKITDHCEIYDTLPVARKKHPGQKNNLDALCSRYGINNSNRTLHGALLDAQILGSVYLAMTGGQSSFFDEGSLLDQNLQETAVTSALSHLPDSSGELRPVTGLLRVIPAEAAELAAHEQWMTRIKKKVKS